MYQIFPPNRNIFTDVVFAEEEQRHVQVLDTSNNVEQSKDRNETSEFIEAVSNRDDFVGIQADQPEPNETPANSSLPNDQASSPFSVLFQPEDISPIPQLLKNATSRAPRAVAANRPTVVLTASPYQKALKDSLAKKNNQTKKKTVKSNGGKTLPSADNAPQIMSLNAEDDHSVTSGLISEPAKKKKKMRKKSTSELARMFSTESNDTNTEEDVSLRSDSADDLLLHEFVDEYSLKPAENVECLFCGKRFFKSYKQKLLIQCTKCNEMVHVLCSACETDSFTCDFCLHRPTPVVI